jgi:beta-lactam-binding protein with PASTA domain
VKKKASKKVKKGRMISESPAAGSKLAAGSPVNLVVSAGPPRRRR